MFEFGRRGRQERSIANPAAKAEVFAEEKMGTYEDIARRDEDMRRLLDIHKEIRAHQEAGNGTGADSARLLELEQQIAARYERSWRER